MCEPDSKVGVGADLNYLIHYNIIKVDHIQTPLCGEGEVIGTKYLKVVQKDRT